MLVLIAVCASANVPVPAPVSAQKVPFFSSTNNQPSGQGTIAQASLPETNEDIDKSIAQTEARIAELRKEGAAASEAAGNEQSGLLAAAPEELRQRQRLLNQLVNKLERHAQDLRELKEARKTAGERSAEIRSWQGFTETPPFSISLLDSLRDAIFSQRLDLDTLELKLTIARGDLQNFTKSIKESQKQVRIFRERLERSIGTAAEGRQRWLLDLTQLQNDMNEVGAAVSEMQRLMLQEVIADKKEYVQFLDHKLAVAEKVSPLSKADLEEKLRELDSQRKALVNDINHTLKEEDEFEAHLQKSRDALNNALAGIGPGVKPSSKEFTRVVMLQSAVEAEQVLVETASGNIEVMRGMLQLVDLAQTIWEDRYWLAQDQEIAKMQQKTQQTRLVLANIQIWRRFVETRISKWAMLIQSQREKVDKAGSTETDRIILNAYEERQALLLRAAEGIGRVERLANRLIAELKDKEEHAPFVSWVKDLLNDVLSFVREIWNIELYVAEEEIIAGGTKIVKPVSVTLGKVLKALAILFVGWWLARHLVRPVRWIVLKQFKKDESYANQVGKIFLLIAFIGVLVFALVSVNIPLAVFAFLGGALAIGLGFGAQNLINNFISGLILLFDRSIKVGDIVEVDGQGGKVTEVGMRSSHIRRFDGVELLVPNSQFLQQKVTNWTLSDKRMRYVISVGVAYGSPTRQVSQILNDTVDGHVAVLKDPPIAVLFEEFADSALTFSVYFWLDLISVRDNRAVVSELRHRISEALTGAGMVIAFPQRDVHIDAQTPLPVRVIPPEECR